MKRLFNYLLIFIPSVIILAAIFFLSLYHVPTDILLCLSANQFSFVTEKDTYKILDSIKFKSLVIENFNYLELNPKAVYITDPDNYSFEKDRLSTGSIWSRVSYKNPILIKDNSQNFGDNVTFLNYDENVNYSGSISGIYINKDSGVNINLQKHNYLVLGVTLNNNNIDNTLIFNDPVIMIANDCDLNSFIDLPYRSNINFFKIILPESRSEVKITGKSKDLLYTFTIDPAYGENIFTVSPVYIKSINFTRPDEQGNQVSNLLNEAVLSYRNFPNIKDIKIKPTDIIIMKELNNFIIEKIQLDRDSNIDLQLSGKVGNIKIGTSNFSKNYCLTYFDIIWNNQKLLLFFSIFLWLISTTTGIYKLYKELKKGDKNG